MDDKNKSQFEKDYEFARRMAIIALIEHLFMLLPEKVRYVLKWLFYIWLGFLLYRITQGLINGDSDGLGGLAAGILGIWWMIIKMFVNFFLFIITLGAYRF